MKKQKTWLPLFTGFYDSIFDPSDNYIEMETELREDEFKDYYEDLHKAGVTQEFFNENFYDYLDYNKGYEGAASYICDGLENLESADIIQEVTFEKVVSPKYYNFSTDSINCEIEYDDEKLIEYLTENKEAFKDYIESKYTSRDGFSSSYSNDLEYWLDAENHGDHEVGSILQFVLENESEDAVMDLYYGCNCEEGFMDSVIFNQEKMISDFKEKNKK